MTFEALAATRKIASQAYWKQCFAYVAMFHNGPANYRKAYRAFLAELRDTGDCEAATRKHLLPLDQARLQTAARAFANKLRPVRVREG